MPTDHGASPPLLASHDFLKVVEHTPLVAIDLVVLNEEKALLGLRRNRPAQGFWFVPGGRIRKDETFDQAFRRITESELGKAFTLHQGQFLGLFQHLYSDCFVGENTTTHYVVCAFRLRLGSPPPNLPKEQHGDYGWFCIDEIPDMAGAHENTRAYFRHHPHIQVTSEGSPD